MLGRRNTWDVAKMLEFGRLTRDQDIDIVHSHGRGTMRFVSLCRALGIVDCPHVFHDHFGRLHLDRSAGPRASCRCTTASTTTSGWSRGCATGRSIPIGFPADRVDLVRSGVDLTRFDVADAIDLRREFDLGDCELALVMIANFRPQKDHATLFRALAELSPADRDRIRIVDRGQHHRRAGLLPGLRRHAGPTGHRPPDQSGRRPRAMRPHCWQAPTPAVFSSKNESGPLVLLEYMASSLPFLATETGEIAHAVKGRPMWAS